jgi:hypothetical protein
MQQQRMKMMFFSADNAEVAQVGAELTQAGIPCEVRNGAGYHGKSTDVELWIRNDRDSHKAFMVCVQRGIGFARRPVETVDFDN